VTKTTRAINYDKNGSKKIHYTYDLVVYLPFFTLCGVAAANFNNAPQFVGVRRASRIPCVRRSSTNQPKAVHVSW